MTRYNVKLKNLRMAQGLTPHEVAARSGLSSPEYYDLEMDPYELGYTLDLKQVMRVLSELNSSINAFLSLPPSPPISLKTVVQLLATKSPTHIEDLENKIGWELKSVIANEQEIWDRPIFFLCKLCRVLEVDTASLLLGVDQEFKGSQNAI